MKKLVIILLSIVALAFSVVFAEETPQYVELQTGSKGEEVVNLQERLNELNYNAGVADGIYGKGTATAVSLFQQQNGLDVTGIADVKTQELLYSPDCPVAIVYEELDWDGVSRYPDDYQDKYVQFDGYVLQVVEGFFTVTETASGGTLVSDRNYALRVATDGKYDDVVFVVVAMEDVDGRILEDDKITIWGTYDGIYEYTTVMGSKMSLPRVNADTLIIEMK